MVLPNPNMPSRIHIVDVGFSHVSELALHNKILSFTAIKQKLWATANYIMSALTLFRGENLNLWGWIFSLFICLIFFSPKECWKLFVELFCTYDSILTYVWLFKSFLLGQWKIKVFNHFAQCSVKVTLERTKFTPSTMLSGEITMFSYIPM